MRPVHSLAVGLILSLPFASDGSRLAADGLLKRHHHHDDDDQSTTVRLPAQNIRIETASPRVVVGQVGGHTHRARGYAFAPAFAPIASSNFVATVLPMTINPGAQNLASSGALDAVHALERQHLEVARQKAALAAEMNLLDRTAQRVSANITASGSASFTGQGASDDVRKALEDLSKRISDVERLLIVHDNILKGKKEKE